MALGVKCLDCHAIKKPGFAAGLPKDETCMACHATLKTDSQAVQKLTGYFKEKKPVPWVRVYRVPDYEWFSHESHHKDARIACESWLMTASGMSLGATRPNHWVTAKSGTPSSVRVGTSGS